MKASRRVTVSLAILATLALGAITASATVRIVRIRVTGMT